MAAPAEFVNPDALIVTLLFASLAVTRRIVSPESTVPVVPEVLSSTKTILPPCQADPVVHEVPLELMQSVTRFPCRADSERASARSVSRSFVAVARRLFCIMVLKLGPASAASIPTIATTISNSIKVNPDCCRSLMVLPLFSLY